MHAAYTTNLISLLEAASLTTEVAATEPGDGVATTHGTGTEQIASSAHFTSASVLVTAVSPLRREVLRKDLRAREAGATSRG